MSRLFDAVDDKIEATIKPMDVGDWTLGCWAFPISVGEGNQGMFLGGTDASSKDCQFLYFTNNQGGINALQGYTGTYALTSTVTSVFPVLSAWYSVFATHTEASRLTKIYLGSLTAPVVESSYAAQTAGVGQRLTGGSLAIVGNEPGQTLTFDGRIARPFWDARLWTLDEMEEFRLGHPPIALAVADV